MLTEKKFALYSHFIELGQKFMLKTILLTSVTVKL